MDRDKEQKIILWISIGALIVCAIIFLSLYPGG